MELKNAYSNILILFPVQFNYKKAHEFKKFMGLLKGGYIPQKYERWGLRNKIIFLPPDFLSDQSIKNLK